MLYIFGSWALIKVRLDDAVDAIPVHMINGAWGLIGVGLFASPSRLQDFYMSSDHVGFFYSFGHGGADATLLACQLIGLLFIFGWVMFLMLPFFVWLDWKGWFRADPLEEIVGLDTSYHGGIMLGGDDTVSPEYINAFQRRREESRKNNRGTAPNTVAPEDEDDYVADDANSDALVEEDAHTD